MFDVILVWRGPVKVSVIWFVKIRAASQSSAGVIALEFDGMAKTSVSAWSTHHDCQFEPEHVLCFVIHCCYRYQINDSASNPKFLAWTNFSGPGPDFNFQFSPLFNFSPRPRVTLRLGGNQVIMSRVGWVVTCNACTVHSAGTITPITSV